MNDIELVQIINVELHPSIYLKTPENISDSEIRKAFSNFETVLKNITKRSNKEMSSRRNVFYYESLFVAYKFPLIPGKNIYISYNKKPKIVNSFYSNNPFDMYAGSITEEKYNIEIYFQNFTPPLNAIIDEIIGANGFNISLKIKELVRKNKESFIGINYKTNC